MCENGKFCGIITERDDVIGVVAPSRGPGATPASSVMSKDGLLSLPMKIYGGGVNVMADRSIKVLPVVQDGKLAGLHRLDDLTRKSQALAAMVFSRSIKPPAYN